MFSANKEQLEEWKKKHGEVFRCVVGDRETIEVDGKPKIKWAATAKCCYLRKPRREEVSYSMTIKNNPLKSDEILLNNCWLGGDEEVRTDDAYFMGIRNYLGNLIETKEAEMLKL